MPPLGVCPYAHQPCHNFQTTPGMFLCAADLEWRLTYIGNAESEEYDQVLDSVLVGPVVPGQYRFVFQVSMFSEEACDTFFLGGLCVQGGNVQRDNV
jgi:ASF1 like histone chaperone